MGITTNTLNGIKGIITKDGSLKTESVIGIVFVIALIILGVLYYYMYIYDSLERYRITLLNKPKSMDNKDKQGDIIISPTGVKINPSETEVSYSMWLFLEDFGFKYGKKKHIFSHGYNPRFYPLWKDHRIMVKLGEINNTLEISLTSHKEDSKYCMTDVNDVCMNINAKEHRLFGALGTKQNFILHNIPIKKWTHLLISIVGDTASVYINGNLVKEIILIGEIVPLTKGYIFIGSNFDDKVESGFGGKLSKVEVFRKNLEPGEVYSIYREGNIPKEFKKKKYLKSKDVSCLKSNKMGCDSRYEFDTHKNGCCPNLRCSAGKCLPQNNS